MFFNINKAIYHSVESNLLETVHSMPSAWVKRYIKVRWMLKWGFLGFGSVLAWMPESVLAQKIPSYVQAVGTESDGVAGDSTLRTQELIGNAVSTFDTLWDTYLTQNSPYFGILLNATRYIVAVGFLSWMVAAVWKWVQSNYEKFPWQMAFTPLLVVILYANGGQLTLIGLQAYKGLVYGANSYMLNQTYNGVSGLDLIKQANTQQGIQNAYDQKLKSCERRPLEQQEKCIEEVKAEIKEAEKQLNKNNEGGGFQIDIGKALNSVVQGAVVGFLSFIAGLFHLIMAYALAVWASSAPIWIAIGLYPASKGGLQIFVSGLFAAMLSIWMFTILQIALASQQSTALGIHGLLYPFLGGFINPLVAVFAGSMGFSAVFAAGGVAAGTVVKLVKRS